ncbi:MAG TPA: hypothetical protein VFS45_00235 [Sphingomicrobium sp.]|nr:hypothetical protein [Sphingomicrobium sp.]
MAHDRDYFRRRAAEARSAALGRDDREGMEVAGYLALAYAALARRRAAPARPDAADAVDPADSSAVEPVPLMLRTERS